MEPIDDAEKAGARERAWAVVEECVAGGPVSLGQVVGRIEAELDDSRSIRSVSAFLQDMVRGGRIQLINDGCRWTVCAGAKGDCGQCRHGALRRLGQWIGRPFR